ncbi:MAG TPA: nitrous oxide reductase family maturation protein NosD [Thermoanaerobaculia bacterium]|nr:nitrous oxide reductase family maturation protein NosD [Thermoanaerobaculia bacterium]
MRAGAGATSSPVSQRLLLVLGAVGAAALIFAAQWLPMWQMWLQAPQYPNGLSLVAYGDRIEGDLAEINIINHYIGMAEIEARPVVEMRLFRYAVMLLALGALASVFSRFLLRLVLIGVIAMPVAILADLQYWLYRYGHDLDPSAPLRFVEPFTPLAIGISKIGNFRSIATVSWGFLALLGAVALLIVALRCSSRLAAASAARPAMAARATAALLGVLGTGLAWLALPAGVEARDTSGSMDGARAAAELQARLDAAPPGSRVEVRGGVYLGALTIRGPLVVEGIGEPVLDGGGTGSVVTVEGDGVVFRGFVVRNSGRAISEEAAAIKVTGSRHRIEDNRIHDVYFGIHLSNGEHNVVRRNVVEPAGGPDERPGHGLSLWYQRGALVEGNRVTRARDGIYLSFSDDVRVVDNEVSRSRYGVHSMYSMGSSFERNEIHDNLLGAALMYSQGLSMRCNRIAGHREGATAYAILLKDVADVRIEGNVLAGNRVAIYADNTPLSFGAEALVAGNHITGNEAALALQSTARLTVSENVFVDNLAMVRLEGRQLSSGSVWSRDGRGNHWDDYRGFDRDRDGVGDLPYRHVLALPEMLRGDAPARALLWTPAHQVVEAAARLFPVVRPVPVIDDPAPLMQPPARWACPEVTR